MKLLLLSLGGIGDFIECVPAIRALRSAWTEALIELVVEDRVAPYARRCPYVDCVYACPVPNSKMKWTGWASAGIRIPKLLWSLRLRRYDLLLNFMDVGSAQGSRRMKRFIQAVRPAASCGRNRDGLGNFFSRKVEERLGDGKSDGEYFYDVAALSGRPLPPPAPADLWISEEEHSEAEKIERGIPGEGPLILIHPGSDRETRRWFPERFGAAAAALRRRYGARAVLAGALQDRTQILEIQKHAGDSSIRALEPLASIGLLGALLQRSQLLLCNNSMAMHLSAAAGTPCVAIAASGDVSRDAPRWHTGDLALVYKGIECSPCYHWRCPKENYMECMKEISVEEIVETCQRFIVGNRVP